MREKLIYFRDLPTVLQHKILDMYGVDNPAELGLDVEPYAAVYEDAEGVGAIGVFESA